MSNVTLFRPGLFSLQLSTNFSLHVFENNGLSADYKWASDVFGPNIPNANTEAVKVMQLVMHVT